MAAFHRRRQGFFIEKPAVNFSPTVRPDTTFDQLFGASKVTIEGEYDFRPRVYWDEKAETYVGEIKSRPLCLPVSIDRFGCLNTKIPA